jgi:hypothetical protein
MGTAASAPVEKPQHITVEFDVRKHNSSTGSTQATAAVFLEQAACISTCLLNKANSHLLAKLFANSVRQIH